MATKSKTDRLCPFWWMRDESEVYRGVQEHTTSLWAQQDWMYAIDEENERLYSGRMGNTQSGRYGVYVNNQVYAIRDNVISSIVDTLTAMVASNRPRAQFISTGGNWTQQKEAKKYTKYTDGLFRKLKVYKTTLLAFRDSLITGQAWLKVDKQNGEAYCERIRTVDILVDQIEARDGKYRQMHQRSLVDKEVLKGLFPGNDELIDAAPRQFTNTLSAVANSRTANMVEITESWHLRSPKGDGEFDDDGMYAVTMANGTLMAVQWEKDYFPFLHLNYTDPLEGTNGIGLVERLARLQLQYDKANRFVEKAHDRIITPMIFGDSTIEYDDEIMSTEIGLFFSVKDAKPPTFFTPTALNAETYNERERILERMFAISGLNEMYSQGKKQIGSDSGVAIREVNDIQLGRFAPQTQAFEDLHVDIAQRLIWVAKDLHEEGHDVEVTSYGKHKQAEVIKWSDMTHDDETFIIDVEASSILPKTPAGKLATANDMLKANAITPQVWMKLLDMPDLEAYQTESNASVEDIMAVCENLEDGPEKWEAPSPFQDLKLGMKMLPLHHNKIRRMGAPNSVLSLYRRWVALAKSILDDMAKKMEPDPAMMPPTAMPPDPMAGAPMPMAPPAEPPPMLQ